jgi:hypothetical protein
MIFFFEKNGEYLRCDIHTAPDGEGYELVLINPDGTETAELHSSADAVFRRWTELQGTLKSEGWWGPHGRDL